MFRAEKKSALISEVTSLDLAFAVSSDGTQTMWLNETQDNTTLFLHWSHPEHLGFSVHSLRFGIQIARSVVWASRLHTDGLGAHNRKKCLALACSEELSTNPVISPGHFVTITYIISHYIGITLIIFAQNSKVKVLDLLSKINLVHFPLVSEITSIDLWYWRAKRSRDM